MKSVRRSSKRSVAHSASQQSSTAYFRISAGLQRILGRDLVTSELVAVFELVKNAYDANAKNVELIFGKSELVIADDGTGMSLLDIQEKWLFVAYSSKQHDAERRRSSRTLAGSKGVGRFSCDRLGASLMMETKVATAKDVEQVVVNWTEFESSPLKDFGQVPVSIRHMDRWTVPCQLATQSHGTRLKITDLRDNWGRDQILRLRNALTRLINPISGLKDFSVRVTAPHFEDADNKLKARQGADSASVVNGPIRNFLFESLKSKTTTISARVDSTKSELVTELVDRDAMIYRLREPLPYKSLRGHSVKLTLFYLNKAAKIAFAHRMGMHSVAFGSVFLFLNGFRVFPIGEEEDDYFGVNRRKQQGHSRFLGTRDLIGKLEVEAGPGDSDFREASSRDRGLLETPAVQQLRKFLVDILKRLEDYVTNVNWKLSAKDRELKDSDFEDPTQIASDEGTTLIAKALATLLRKSDVQNLKIEINPDVVRLLDTNSDYFETSIRDIRDIAEKTNNASLLAKVKKAEGLARELTDARHKAEARMREAEAQSEQEREARQQAEAQAAKERERAETMTHAHAEQKKRNRFLASLTSLDLQTVISFHHQILIYTSDATSAIRTIRQDRTIQRAVQAQESIQQLHLSIQKIEAVAGYAAKAKFSLNSEMTTGDLFHFVQDYISELAPIFQPIRLSVVSSNVEVNTRFRPIDLMVVFDNLLSNARKARASNIVVDMSKSSQARCRCSVVDDGNGIDAKYSDLADIFEPGETTTHGSGLGLTHVRQVVTDLGGSVQAMRRERGAEFVFEFPIQVTK